MDEEEEAADRPDALVLSEPAGAISLQNVSFGYRSGQTVIKDLNLDVQPGQLVAIVGPPTGGAGKTTLVNLLMRFYDLNGGAVLLLTVKI